MSSKHTKFVVSWLLAAVVCLAEEPPDTASRTNSIALPMDGVIYDPRVDYDEGVFEAEEEIRKGQPTIWVLAYEKKPPAKDPATGLPIKYIVVDPDEPWHEKCMKERIRGHNDHILSDLVQKHGEATKREESDESSDQE